VKINASSNLRRVLDYLSFKVDAYHGLMLAKGTFVFLCALSVASVVITLEENISNSDLNIFEEVAWFHRQRKLVKTPLDRLFFNFRYWRARTKMNLRFSWLVKPFIGFA